MTTSKYSVGGKRGQVAYDNKEGKGARSGGAIDASGSTLKWWKPNTQQEGYNTFEIVPWIHSGKNITAEQMQAGIQQGSLEFVLNYFVHRNCGPSKQQVLCAKKTFGRGSCTPCADANDAYNAKDKRLGAALKSGARSIMVVRPHGPNGPTGLFLFDVSHFLFTKELVEKATVVTRGNGMLPFYEPGLTGKLIECRAIETEKEGMKMVEFKDFTFYDRTIPVTDEEIESLPCLNDMLVVLSSAEIDAIYYGAPDEEPAHAPPAAQQEQPATQGYRPPQAAAAAPAYNSGMLANPSAYVAPAAVAPPEEQPATQGYRPPQAAAAEPKAEPATRQAPAAVTSCPNGYEFGKDADAKELCSRCPSNIWRECDKASKAT